MIKKISVLVFLTYFLAAFFTLDHYGISWDEPTHFKRGQAYLWYFFTRNTSYEGLPEYDVKRAQQDPKYHKRSLYQNNSQDTSYHLNTDGDHPPLNGILAAATNYVFYQKLGWLGDIESYHLFEILTSAMLVAVVFLFAAETFGVTAGLFASIFLATYPLFWAESHFNIKDPIETAFFGLTIYTFYKGIIEKKARSLIISSIFAGMGLATKFNIVFLPLILLLWLAILQFNYKLDILKTFLSKKILITIILFPIVMILIFFISWPFLWQDLIGNTLSVLKYYKEIGIERGAQPNLILGIFNPVAFWWIIYTTQPIMLVAFLLGLVSFRKLSKQQKYLFILWLLWFAVPVLRVSLPKATIYGGVRQIMEYIPAMALIAGVGADFFRKRFLRITGFGKLVSGILAVAVLFITVSTLVKIHPNENVYFNFLSGGLKKNMDSGFPSAGFSFGNAYLQGFEWINQNAQPGSKVALIQGTNQNIPSFWPRPDIFFSNYHWSGIKREGEYLMELTHNYDVRVYHYAWEYVQEMLEPVYEVKVDGGSILKIWKNDLEHTKVKFRKKEVPYSKGFDTSLEGRVIRISLSEEVYLSRILVSFTPLKGCVPLKSGSIETSRDGQNWRGEKDPLPYDQLGRPAELSANSFRVMFAAREAKYLKIFADNLNSCILNSPVVTLTVLE